MVDIVVPVLLFSIKVIILLKTHQLFFIFVNIDQFFEGQLEFRMPQGHILNVVIIQGIVLYEIFLGMCITPSVNMFSFVLKLLFNIPFLCSGC